MATSTPGYTVQKFVGDVLAGIGAPDTQQNRNLFYAWIFSEGTKAGFNPLATTQPAAGTTEFNSVGVKNYPNYTTGVTATVQTLQNGYYNGIVNDLRKGNVDPYTIVQNNASEFNTWGTGANLVASNLSGPAPGKVSITQVGANLGTGYGQVGTDVKSIVKGPLDKVGKEILYGIAFLGALLLIALGIILIGADIGLGVFARTKVAKQGNKLVTGRKQDRERGEKQAAISARAETIQRRAEEKHQADLKLKAARASEVRTRQRHRAKAASASKKEVAKREQTAYNRGAEDVLKHQASMQGRKRAK